MSYQEVQVKFLESEKTGSYVTRRDFEVSVNGK